MGEIRGLSGVYETPPEGYAAQPAFLNLVVHLETVLEPRALLGRTREIERDTGRVRSFRNAPRTLDIDILLYGDIVRDMEGLVLPHPRMTRRVFVLAPLVELAPALLDPGTGKPYAECLAELVARRRTMHREESGERVEPGDVGDLSDLGVRRIMDGEELLGETR